MLADLDVIALSPPGFPEPAVARAASRSGFCGGLALEHTPFADIRRLLDALAGTGGRFAVAVGIDHKALRELLSQYAGVLQRVILVDSASPTLAGDIEMLRGRQIEALVEVTTLAEARIAVAAGADGIVLKGNEAGGWVGEETSFILLQHVRPQVDLPLWVRGGIGLYSAAACLAGGANGVVLDWQLALTAEMNLPPDLRAKLRRMDGGETAVLGQDCGVRFRAYAGAGNEAFGALQDYEQVRGLDRDIDAPALAAWRNAVEARAGQADGPRLLACGQDAAFAGPLADRFGTVGGICHALRREARRLCVVAARQPAIRRDGPLAVSHRTRYPILQGPMTRVSDVADFARAVADGGGLPFLALALLRGPQVAALLEKTKSLLGERPWGIGILGFVPKELRDEQLAEVRRHPPPFALIAGGRPDQAAALEREGIHTYLHVPAPGLLSIFLQNGTRRVIFEGRECGGHVGRRSSFVLWNTMIDVLLAHLDQTGAAAEDYHVVFAGGVHDARSAAMVMALAAPLAERGVRVGVLLGTAYLFTREAVETGAIVRGFQDEALSCGQTMLLESGVGHTTRCADTPVCDQFSAAKRQMLAEGRSADEIREGLDRFSLGRLRLASKGVRREEDAPAAQPRLVAVDEEAQRRDGLYMIGQVAALRDEVCTIASLHEEVAGGAAILAPFAEVERPRTMRGACDVAVVGMSCLLPKAGSVGQCWENILNRVSAVTEIPADQWDASLYFDADRRARDKVYSRWGGFLDPVPFDPMRYGMPPNSVPAVEPVQLLVLEAVRQAITDAGYADRPFDRAHTSVIIGAGGGVGNIGLGYGFRSMLPHYLAQADGMGVRGEDVIAQLDGRLPEWTEDSFAGLLLNVIAGRVANRFDLGGTNYTVDAACASSLAAVRLAVNELQSGSSNLVIVGGADTMQSPFAYLCFSKTQALSPTGQCRTFDETADGIVIGEGIAILVLKRLEDAERDGDRIYAVLKGVGASSDGKDKGLTAPRPEGQMRALERAYAQAGISPQTIGLIEAHGTGTVAGDKSEVESLTRVFRAAGAGNQSCAVGSIKSMVGHTKCTAGITGLLKATLALHHKILPPTLGVTRPNPKADFPNSPFYVNAETRPWLRRTDGVPRRAGVSAFGFGGTNFHAVVEEYTPAEQTAAAAVGRYEWPAELFVFRGATPDELGERIGAVTSALSAGSAPRLAELAAAVFREFGRAAGDCCLAVVAESLDALGERLTKAQQVIASGTTTYHDPLGVHYAAGVPAADGHIAFLFPGQGSQRVNMLRDLVVALPRLRAVFEQFDAALADMLGAPLSSFVFPRPEFTDEERATQEAELTQTRVAQPAMGAADLAVFRLLSDLGIRADFFAGHSYGEYVALCAADALGVADLARISEIRGRLLAEQGAAHPGGMAAIDADEATVAELMAGLPEACIANLNSPGQTVISGTPNAITQALARSAERNINARPIKVSAAFHSPLMAAAKTPFAKALAAATWTAPRRPVFANLTGAPHSAEPAAVQQALVEHLTSPVRFVDEIRSLYAAGARVFVEVGPGRTLSGLVEKTLTGQDFTTVILDQGGRHGLVQLAHALAQLAVAGVRFDAAAILAGREGAAPPLTRLLDEAKPKPPSPTTWLVSGNRAVPVAGQSSPTAKRAAAPRPAAPPRTPTVTAPAAQSGEDGSPAASPPTAPPTPIPPAPAASPLELPTMSTRPTGDGIDAVMAAHHQFMTRFVEAHKAIMLAYLRGEPAVGTSTPAVSAVDSAPPALTPPAAPAQRHAELVTVDRPPPTAAPTALLAERSAVQMTPGSHGGNGDGHAAPPPPAPVPVATEAGVTRAEMLRQLTRVVSDRTGYPPDMLGLDLDLEADLGIDSIKRIEILGTLQKEGILPSASAGGDMEVLGKLGTLRAIVDWFEAHAPSAPAPAKATTAAQLAPGNAESVQPAPRMVLEVTDVPFESEDHPFAPDGLVLITDDGAGVAERLAESLRSAGAEVQIVRVRQPSGSLADPAEAERFVASLRAAGRRVAVLVHLAGLGVSNALPADPTAWEDALQTSFYPLFNLAKLLEADLRRGPRRILAATRLGGRFLASADVTPADIWPGHGAVAGLVKTIAREWAETACKIVDFESAAGADAIAAALLNELNAADRLLEVGYSANRRITLRPAPAPLATGEPRLALDAGAVVLITGGARGITAEVARELAERFHCTLVLVGRTAPSEGDEAPDTAGLTDQRALKAALRDQYVRRNEPATPATIEVAYKRLLAVREIRGNLAALRATGAQVEYAAVNVADPVAFAALIEGLYARHGRLDGVIHGAGVIEDRLLRDKTLDALRRVMAPKVTGAAVLAAHLRADSLRFLAFFSSVSGRYGNRGQADYAAANEVINKLAAALNARWAARIVAFNWGPWESSGGMVSPELARQFAAAGVHVLSRPAGRRAFLDELLFGNKAHAEVIFGGPLRLPDSTPLPGPSPTASQAPEPAVSRPRPVYPLLATNVTARRRLPNSLEITRRLDPAQDFYLRDHQLDAKPVLPMAMVLELLAECAADLRPELNFVAIHDLHVLRGITLENGPVNLHVSALVQREDEHGAQIALTMRCSDGRDVRYTASAEMRRGRPAAPRVPRLTLPSLRPLPRSVPQAYEEWLFHGPIFAGIREVQGVDRDGIIAHVSASRPRECLAECPESSWLVDPVVVDSGLQLIILWARANLDMTPLPSRLGSYHCFGGPFAGDILAEVSIRATAGNPNILVDIRFRDNAGTMIGWIEDLEVTCSRSLNRLAGGQVGSAEGRS